MKQKDIEKKILVRRLQLWVHSYIYYKLNTNVVSDYTWSKWARELVALQREYPKQSQAVALYGIFSDFDGSTGMDFPFDIPFVKEKAEAVLNRTVEELFLLEGAEA